MTLRTYQEFALGDNSILSQDIAKELDAINELVFQTVQAGEPLVLSMCEDGCTRALALLCLYWSQLVALDTPDRADVVRARTRDFANRVAAGIISYQTVLTTVYQPIVHQPPVTNHQLPVTDPQTPSTPTPDTPNAD